MGPRVLSTSKFGTVPSFGEYSHAVAKDVKDANESKWTDELEKKLHMLEKLNEGAVSVESDVLTRLPKQKEEAMAIVGASAPVAQSASGNASDTEESSEDDESKADEAVISLNESGANTVGKAIVYMKNEVGDTKTYQFFLRKGDHIQGALRHVFSSRQMWQLTQCTMSSSHQSPGLHCFVASLQGICFYIIVLWRYFEFWNWTQLKDIVIDEMISRHWNSYNNVHYP